MAAKFGNCFSNIGFLLIECPISFNWLGFLMSLEELVCCTEAALVGWLLGAIYIK